jgi:hypothetical protein
MLNVAVNEGLADPEILARFTEVGALPIAHDRERARQADCEREQEVAQTHRVRRHIDQ